MKKKCFACTALALPLLIFTGCGGGAAPLTLSANWYAASNITNNITNTSETLTYAVTFEPTEGRDFTVSYDEGTYTTTLVNENVTESSMGYHLTTELTITGRYILNGERGEDFTDVVRSEVWFLDVTTVLRPIRSEKYVLTHSAPSSNPADLEHAYNVYEYTYTTEYNADCTEANITVEYTQPEDVEPEETTVSLSGSGSYLDNETILFAWRGISPSEVSSLRTINPVTRQQTTVSMTAAPTTASRKATFAINGGGEQEYTLDAYTFTYGYTGTNSGQPQELTYAAKVTEGGVNTYRNVLLEMRVPVLQSMGELVYTLKSAVFNDK